MNQDSMTPVEALESMVLSVSIYDRWNPMWAERRKKRGDTKWAPGRMVQWMPEHMREALKRLRSDDIAKVRDEVIASLPLEYKTPYESNVRKLLVAFDREFLHIRERQYREKKY